MMEEDRRKEEEEKKKVQGCLVHIFSQWPPCTFQPWNFTAMKLRFCIAVGEDVMLTYLCVLIAQLAGWLTDCLTGGMTI